MFSHLFFVVKQDKENETVYLSCHFKYFQKKITLRWYDYGIRRNNYMHLKCAFLLIFKLDSHFFKKGGKKSAGKRPATLMTSPPS